MQVIEFAQMKKWIFKENVFWSLIVFVLIAFCNEVGLSQITVFSDDFSANSNSAWTTSGNLGGSAWNVFRSGNDWGGRRNISPLQLELTNDVSAAENADGYVFASTPTTLFSSPYSTILDQGGVVSWSFNMRQNQADPEGFDISDYGVAFILAAEASATNTTGSGYAIVLGQSLEIDPVRLVRFSEGIGGNNSITNIIISNTQDLTDFGDDYLSIQVIYNPCQEDQWELLVRNDGAAGFEDPLSGELISQGTANDNTYTGIALEMMAAYWQGSILPNSTAFFDNVVVTATNIMVEAGNYESPCMNDPDIELMGSPSGGIWTGLGVSGNSFNPSFGTQTLTYTITDDNGCTASDQVVIVVDDCIMPPEMRWILLEEGVEEGSCESQSDCDDDIICYGLQYTPDVSGVLSSYTTGFIVDCNMGQNPIVSNASCVMSNMSSTNDECEDVGQVLINSSGNTGIISVMQGISIIIHQVCFSVPSTGIINIIEDETTNLTTSIDLPGGGAITEEPSYNDFAIDSTVDCTILPVRYLDFNVVKRNENASWLSWITAEEFNNSHFEIERSVNDGRTFVFMGKVQGNPNSKAINQYDFIDSHPMPGVNYYRLKQYDLDGRFEYSPVRTVNFGKDEFNVRVWPNPVSERLMVNIDGSRSSKAVYLLDYTGTQIFYAEMESETTTLEISSVSFPSGVYTLVIDSGFHRRVEKIIIMN